MHGALSNVREGAVFYCVSRILASQLTHSLTVVPLQLDLSLQANATSLITLPLARTILRLAHPSTAPH
eukprot:4007828-Pleurochrysis_carterae.AAC.15